MYVMSCDPGCTETTALPLAVPCGLVPGHGLVQEEPDRPREGEEEVQGVDCRGGVEKLKQPRGKQIADYMSNFASIGYDHTSGPHRPGGAGGGSAGGGHGPPGNRREGEGGPGPS